LTSTPSIGKKNQEQKESQYETHRQKATHNHDPSIHRNIHAGRKIKDRMKQLRITIKHDISERQSIYKEYKFSLIDSQAKYEGVHYLKRKKSLQRKSKSTPPQQQAPWRKKARER
jgi:hypothetical protein